MTMFSGDKWFGSSRKICWLEIAVNTGALCLPPMDAVECKFYALLIYMKLTRLDSIDMIRGIIFNNKLSTNRGKLIFYILAEGLLIHSDQYYFMLWCLRDGSKLLPEPVLADHKWDPGPHFNIKTVLSTYGYFHVKDKTAVGTSYL